MQKYIFQLMRSCNTCHKLHNHAQPRGPRHCQLEEYPTTHGS